MKKFMLLFILSPLFAEETSLIDAKFEVDQKGKMYLVVEGEAIKDSMWLGVSLYPRFYQDPIWDGRHMVIPIKKKGKFVEKIEVEETFRGGYYEIALWEQLLEKKTLYKMEGLRDYKKGELLPQLEKKGEGNGNE
jgi:hypothetical protein